MWFIYLYSYISFFIKLCDFYSILFRYVCYVCVFNAGCGITNSQATQAGQTTQSRQALQAESTKSVILPQIEIEEASSFLTLGQYVFNIL